MQTIEKLVYDKTIKELSKEFPDLKDKGLTLSEFPEKVIQMDRIDELYVNVPKPITAVIFGKGLYLKGKYKDDDGLFLLYVAHEGAIRLVFNPTVE